MLQTYSDCTNSLRSSYTANVRQPCGKRDIRWPYRGSLPLYDVSIGVCLDLVTGQTEGCRLAGSTRRSSWSPFVTMPRATRSAQKARTEPVTVTTMFPEERVPKRERSLRACTRCRQRKQKCDNALPNCGNCAKAGLDCEAFPIDVVSRDNLFQ